MFTNELTPAEAAQILRDRAMELARVEAESIDGEDLIQVVCFRLGQESVAIAADYALELLLVDSITTVPHTPPHFVGITNLRGHVTAIVDLCVMLEIAGAENPRRQALAVGYETPEFAISVDGIDHVKTIRRSDLVDAPVVAYRELILGMTADGLLVFDGQQLLNCQALYVDEVD